MVGQASQSTLRLVTGDLTCKPRRPGRLDAGISGPISLHPPFPEDITELGARALRGHLLEPETNPREPLESVAVWGSLTPMEAFTQDRDQFSSAFGTVDC